MQSWKRDHLIKYKEVPKFLKNPPTLLPCPDFANLRAMQNHIVKALKRLIWPQSMIHGWSGLVLSPMVYALLKPNPFVAPTDPGAVVVYTQFCGIHTVCITRANQNRRHNVHTSAEWVRLVQKYYEGVLPHAQWKRLGSIQGLQCSNPYWLERKHDHTGNTWPARQYVWKTWHNDVVT